MFAQKSLSTVIPAKDERVQRFSWKEYGILVFASMFGTLVGIPSILPAYQKLASAQNTTVLVLLGGQTVQTLFWMMLTVGVGLFLAGHTGLGAPILRGALLGEHVGARFRSHILPSVLLAVVAMVITKALDAWFFMPRLPGFSSAISQVSGWQGFLASFYGGITEEILVRLFILTVVAWLVGKMSHTADGRPSGTAMWIAILVAAMLFGVWHLPATLASMPFSTILLGREIVLNGIGGTVFGYLYWKRGLESSMMSHFSADLLIHVVFPFFGL